MDNYEENKIERLELLLREIHGKHFHSFSTFPKLENCLGYNSSN